MLTQDTLITHDSHTGWSLQTCHSPHKALPQAFIHNVASRWDTQVHCHYAWDIHVLRNARRCSSMRSYWLW